MNSELYTQVGDWLLSTTVDVALLVGALLLVERFAGRHLGPASRYLLWSLVLVRLLLPTLPEDPLGWKAAAPPATEAADATVDVAPTTLVMLPDSAAYVPPARTRTGRLNPSEEITALQQDGKLTEVAATMDAAASPKPRRAPTSAPIEAAASATADDPTLAALDAAPPLWSRWREMLVLIWAVGATSLLIRLLWMELRFRHALVAESHAATPELQAAVDRARRNAGMRRPIRVLVTHQVPSPAVAGILRPRLLMPPDALERLDAAELRHVLAHEVAHLRAFDPLFRWGLAIARALHWHHPLAWLGLRRAQEAQEVLRDYQALGAQPDADPGDYAGTLLKLGTPAPWPQPAPLSAILEDGSNLKQRIQMIIDFPLRRGSTVLGATLIAGLAWASLTGASPSPQTYVPPETAIQESDLKKIRVVRRNPVPTWKTAMLNKLNTPIKMETEATLQDIVRALRDQAGVNIVLDPDMDTTEELQLNMGGRTAKQVLDLVEQVAGCSWGLSPGVVLIDNGQSTASNYDLRFYSVTELIGPTEEPFEVADQIQDTLYNLSWNHWETEYASMSYFNGLLVVNQTDRGHDRIENILNLLLNRGRTAPPTLSPAQAKMQARLDAIVDVNFDDQGFAAVTRALSEQTGVPIFVHPDSADGSTISLELSGLSLREVLQWIGRQTWTNVIVEDEMVRFGESPPTEVRVYDIEDLLSRSIDSIEVSEEQLISLTQSSVGWEAWDIEGSHVSVWNGMLVVQQVPAAHAGIDGFLKALRTAL